MHKPEAPPCQGSDSTASNRCQGYPNFTQQLEQTSHVMAKKRDKAKTDKGILAQPIWELKRKIESTHKKSRVDDSAKRPVLEVI